MSPRWLMTPAEPIGLRRVAPKNSARSLAVPLSQRPLTAASPSVRQPLGYLSAVPNCSVRNCSTLAHSAGASTESAYPAQAGLPPPQMRSGLPQMAASGELTSRPWYSLAISASDSSGLAISSLSL